jgi:nicotinate-nucleotide adenylyltransferase
MDRRKRIAFYGGTFDPIHLGHFAVARSVTELFEIDELLFVPARQAPHKMRREVAPALHRYAMLALATQSSPQLSISTFELDAAGRSYTVDTLAHFKNQLGDLADLFFVMGADSWAEITSWHEWERLLLLTNHIVVTRPGYSLPLPAILTGAQVVDLRGADAKELAARSRGTGPQRIFFTDAVMSDVSATRIRQALKEKTAALDGMVPAAVADYIRKYRLYEDWNEN